MAEVQTVCSRIRRILTSISVEPAAFLITVTFGLSGIIAQNLLIEKVCTINLSLNDSICDHLDQHKDDQARVQKAVTIINTYNSILSSSPGILISLLVGSWSETHGRKPLMVFPVIGAIVTNICLLLLTYFDNVRAEWILVTSITGLFGGWTCFVIGVFSYLSDTTPVSSRTFRIALLDLMFFAGWPTGTALSGVIYKSFGYYYVFGTGAAIGLFALVYVTCRVRETKGPNATNPVVCADEVEADLRRGQPECERRMLFHYSHLVSVFRTCFKRRANHVRRVILLLMFSMLLNAAFGPSVTYLYTRLKFGWTEQEFTIWSAVNSVITSLGSAVLLPMFSYKFGFHDGIIGCMGALSGMSSALVLALITQPWMMYLSSSLGLMASGCSVIVRSVISKVAPPSEFGTIVSLIACLESMTPILTAPAMTLVYNTTIATFPGAVYAIQASSYFVIFTILLYAFYLLTRTGVPYGSITEGEEEEEEEVEEDDGLLDDSVAVGQGSVVHA